ncbi:tetratricopeptide repeat protein [bacterium]|nr:tetratricopeptide repeat protein [bacterium]
MEDVKDLIKTALNFHQNGNLDEAEKLYAEILNQDSKKPDVLNLYGLLKYQKQEFSEAIDLIKSAVELNPCAYFYENLGRVYVDSGNSLEAIKILKKALALEPDNYTAWFTIAKAFKENKQIKNSIKAYRKALTLNPNSPEIYFNLAGIFDDEDMTPTAINCYKKTLEFVPNDLETNYFLSVSYLKMKDFEKGWQGFECRPSKAMSIATQNQVHENILVNKKMWNGEDLRDKTLFILYEAGLGDTLMFARYIPILKKYCGKILFAPQNDLVSFFDENFKDIGIITSGTPNEAIKFDYFIPIMSLAFYTQNMLTGIPFASGYLHPDLNIASYFREKYFNNNAFKIGIKWEGNAEIGLNRIINIEAFEKIAQLPNVKIYSLQKGPGVEQLENCKFEITDLAPEFDDFSKTAAAVDNLDLVICNDTSIAHLAGAMAKDCFVLLPRKYNWRWHNDLSYSPWYKNVKLFRQPTEGDWDSVMQSVYDLLINVVPH